MRLSLFRESTNYSLILMNINVIVMIFQRDKFGLVIKHHPFKT
jgi:hypothetical protein